MRHQIKIVLVGDGGVGKTSFVLSLYNYLVSERDSKLSDVALHTDKFSLSKELTPEELKHYFSNNKNFEQELKNLDRTKFTDFHVLKFKSFDDTYYFQIWDLQGQRFSSRHVYTSIHPLDLIGKIIIGNASIILFFHDITANSTFNELFRPAGYYATIQPLLTKNQKLFLLSNKIDGIKDMEIEKINLPSDIHFEDIIELSCLKQWNFIQLKHSLFKALDITTFDDKIISSVENESQKLTS